jgi:hypothetical protein
MISFIWNVCWRRYRSITFSSRFENRNTFFICYHSSSSRCRYIYIYISDSNISNRVDWVSWHESIQSVGRSSWVYHMTWCSPKNHFPLVQRCERQRGRRKNRSATWRWFSKIIKMQLHSNRWRVLWQQRANIRRHVVFYSKELCNNTYQSGGLFLTSFRNKRNGRLFNFFSTAYFIRTNNINQEKHYKPNSHFKKRYIWNTIIDMSHDHLRLWRRRRKHIIIYANKHNYIYRKC